MNSLLFHVIGVVTAFSLIASGSYAEPLKERGGYIGAAYGITKLDDDGALDFGEDFGRFELDENGQAWQIYGGYRFFKFVALEARYTDFGSYTSDGSGIFAGTELEAEYSTFTVHAIGIYPFGLSGFDVFGQLGLGGVFYEEKGKSGALLDPTDDRDTWTWSAGFGVRYTPRRVQQMTIQLAVDIYRFEAEDAFEAYGQTLSMGKLGIQYNF